MVVILTQVTPFVRVRDLDAAVSFFVDTLGFQLGFKAGHYAFMRRDSAAFRIVQDDLNRPPFGHGRYVSYIDVSDVDALWAELKPKLDLLAPSDVEPPCDQEYGQREFAVVGPDGDLIGFGAPIKPA